MSLLDEMPHECSIIRVDKVSTSRGGSKDSEVVEHTEVPCWEQQASASEVMDYRKRGIEIDRKVYFNANYSLTEQHRIRITKRLGVTVSNTIDLDVKTTTLPDASAGLGELFKAMASQHTGDNPIPT